jgi:large subunit ribosomal protein L28
MAKCEICGKTPMFGHNVPHSLHKTKRMWRPNIQKVKITEDGHTRSAYVCSKCLKTMNKTRTG